MGHFNRRSALLGKLDVRTLEGLEIGLRQNPSMQKAEGVIFHVSHAHSELIQQASRNPQFNNDTVDLNVAWGDRPLRELVPHPMDYVVASHVIEHVPDLIGWLMDLHAALTEEGVLCLAIADRRFMFDLRRPESTAGEMVEAYLLRVRRPPARHLFDQVSLQAAFPKARAWEDDMFVQAPSQAEHLRDAHRLAQRVATSGDYVDAHCWVFTPESFLDVASRLSQIGLFPFAIEHFQATEYGDFEFYARLRKSQDGVAIATSLEDARKVLKSSPAEQAYREMLLEKVHAQTLPEPAYRHLLSDLANERTQMEDERRRLDNEIRFLRGVLEAVKTSTSWRVTGPLRWLGRVLKSTRAARKLLYDPLRRKLHARRHGQRPPHGVELSAVERPPALAGKKIAFIAGTAYCGSSLLNLLLDTQSPAIRGLGERSQTDGEVGGPCAVCNSSLKECRLYCQWNGRDFYAFNFNHYGCGALIDSSKRTNILLQAMAREPQFRYYVLHMSKTPHAAAYSILKHWQHDVWDVPLTDAKRDLAEAFNVWIETNQLYVDELRGANVEGVKHIHYDTLAKDPAAVVEEICRWLGEPFDPERLRNWQSPTTHILGGNPGVLMQVLGQGALPGDYLGGKYAHKDGKIFADEVWKRDTVFLTAAMQTYQRLSRKLNPVLAALQYVSSTQMIDECRRLLADSTSCATMPISG